MKEYRVATINLDTRTCREEIFDENLTRAYLGGGLGAYVLFSRTGPKTEALAPESIMCVFNGLLVGTGAPAASKLTFYARSPLTGIWGESTVGGHWPARLKATGYDGLIITGKADAPVTIRLQEDGPYIDSAVDLWGKDTFQTYEILSQRYSGYAIASIGPAGEKSVPIASIMADGPVARAAGRAGLGAVMGSKNVKAIIAFGKKRVDIHDKKKLQASARTHAKSISEKAARIREFGTAGGVQGAEMAGDMGLKNWKIRRWKKGAIKIAAQSFFPEYLEKHHTCHSCAIRCGKLLKQKNGIYAGSISHSPEYETIGGFGGNCLVDDPEVIINANEFCNRNGLDTISASASIAFAMEAYEKNIITDKDNAGKPIKWGDGEVVLGLLEDMISQTGLGKLLSKGVRHAASVLGNESERFAVHIKGLELPLHDPRAFPSMAVSYALAARGADHLEGMSYMYEKGLRLPGYGYQGELIPNSHEHKVQVAHENVCYYSVFNALGLCKFISIGQATLEMITEWIFGVTGWKISVAELLTSGQRLINTKRMYNLGRGITSNDDILPPRLLQLRQGDHPDDGVVPDMKTMISEAYQLRGWDENGVPKPETLKELGLEQVDL